MNVQRHSIGLIAVLFTSFFYGFVKTQEIKVPEKDYNSTGPKIIVIGAGVSGIAATARLLDNGFKRITLLEAENRIGGRVHTVKIGNWTMDLGAHWVHGGPGNPVYDLAAPMGLIEESGDDMGNAINIFSDGTEYDGDAGDKIFHAVYHDEAWIATLNNVSIYDIVLNASSRYTEGQFRSKEHENAYLELYSKLICAQEGCEHPRTISAKRTAEYLTLNSSQTLGWKGRGYHTIIDVLLRKHEKSTGSPIDLNEYLLLNQEVSKIVVGESGGMTVHLSGGKAMEADLVLVTMSVGALREKLDTFFSPPLPEDKKTAIQSIGLFTVDKILLRFPHIWWPANISDFQLMWLKNDKEQSNFGWEKEIGIFSVERWSPYTMVAWVMGEAAKAMEKLPLEQVQRDTMKLMRRFLGNKYNIPEPVEIIRSTWGTNPHFRGSWSSRAMSFEWNNVSTIDYSYPIKNKAGKEVLFFGGEATHNYFFSTVHGAMTSGWREADRIMALYK